MAEIYRFFNGEHLTNVPTIKTVTWKRVLNRIYLDVRTDAVNNNHISVTLTTHIVPENWAVQGLAAPSYTVTLHLTDMNKVYLLEPPFSMKVFSVAASSTNSNKFYLAAFDMFSKDKLDAT